ncbi:hypothetical protein ACQ4M3_13205 [Leptolyngbya sp. AN03gr2]|uniref:hypothetical protein n=1 Tax=unclassified Leptolyngbya TaxID=2650499 RepID=UPI003D314B5D
MTQPATLPAKPKGLPISNLTYRLTPVPPEQAKTPSVNEGWHRFTRKQLDQYKLLYDVEHGVSWDSQKHYIDYELLASTFSLDEMTRWWWNQIISNKVSEQWEQDTSCFRILNKIRNSLWRWGLCENYNFLVEYYNCLKQFQFENCEITLDWVGSYSTYGRSRLAQIYLDGPISYLIHDQGQHRLTISFALSERGLMLCQVQLAQPKQNRWLFRLPTHYLDYTIERLQAAFPAIPIWLVDGGDLAKAICNSYQGEKPDKATFERIQGFYDRPLEQKQRTEVLQSVEDRRMRFWKLK